MSVKRPFVDALARRRNPAGTAHGLIVGGLVFVGVAVLQLLRDGPTPSGLAVVALGGLFVLAGAGLLVLRTRRIRAAGAVLARGMEAEGTVTAIRRRWPSRAYGSTSGSGTRSGAWSTASKR